MTTNQTIDGLDRETLAFALGFKCRWHKNRTDQAADMQHARDKLRALLDAPEVLVVPLTGPKEWLDSLKPAAQPQGEPVAWRGCNADGEVVTEWVDGTPPERMTDLCGSAASFDRVECAYAKQAAPVALVMPERRVVPSPDLDACKPVDAASWNACLDDLKRLNPSQ